VTGRIACAATGCLCQMCKTATTAQISPWICGTALTSTPTALGCCEPRMRGCSWRSNCTSGSKRTLAVVGGRLYRSFGAGAVGMTWVLRQVPHPRKVRCPQDGPRSRCGGSPCAFRSRSARQRSPAPAAHPSFLRSGREAMLLAQSGGAKGHAEARWHSRTPFFQRNPPNAHRPKGRRPSAGHSGAAGQRRDLGASLRRSTNVASPPWPGPVVVITRKWTGAAGGIAVNAEFETQHRP
jgi:hypothetical protein